MKLVKIFERLYVLISKSSGTLSSVRAALSGFFARPFIEGSLFGVRIGLQHPDKRPERIAFHEVSIFVICFGVVTRPGDLNRWIMK